MTTIALGDRPLDLSELFALSRRGVRAAIAPAAQARVTASRSVVESAVARGATMYGINTGFGKLAGVRIADENLA